MKNVICIAILVLFMAAESFAVFVSMKDGSGVSGKRLTDSQGNQILFASTPDGSVLIPFSEIVSMTFVELKENRSSFSVEFRDGTKDLIYLDNNYILMVRTDAEDKRFTISEVASVSMAKPVVANVPPVAVAAPPPPPAVKQVVETPVKPAPVALAEQPRDRTEVAQRGQKDYVIRKHDTLWDISAKFLGDPFRWPEIWTENPYIVNPHLIFPGNFLVISGVHTDRTSVAYREEFADGATQLEDRVLVFDSTPPPSGLIGLRDVSMFKSEREMFLERQVELVDGDVGVRQYNIFGMIEADRYPEFFSYGFHSRLGKLVPNSGYKGDGYLFSRYVDRDRFLKNYAEVRVSLGKNQGVAEGDKFVVIDFKNTRGDLPTFVNKKGEVSIVRVFDDFSVGRITRYFGNEMIFNNDRVMRKDRIEVPRIRMIKFDNVNSTTYVVDRLEDAPISLPGEIFIVRGGTNDGIKPGFVYEIYTVERDGEFSDLPVGEGIIVKTFDNHSLMLLDVRWSRARLNPGDRLEYKFRLDLVYEN